ncbi:class I SAM-dependent methyltransferase [bacterium]|nr:class I SAM-dependent methyltransferase [bacterium]
MVNPWTGITIEDYERHMSDPGVYQLQTLSEIFKAKLHKYKPSSVAILGVCSGNGLEHVDRRITPEVYGIDINASFLKLCEERYKKALPGLHLCQLDLQVDEIPIPEVHMVACHLIFEYVSAGIVIDKISQKVTAGGVASVVIQNNNGLSSISKTGIDSLNRLVPLFHEVSIEDLIFEFGQVGFQKTEQEEIDLPNGKSFTIADFKSSAY